MHGFIIKWTKVSWVYLKISIFKRKEKNKRIQRKLRIKGASVAFLNYFHLYKASYVKFCNYFLIFFYLFKF